MSKLTLSFKGKVLKAFPLDEEKVIIGSDPSCAIHIDSLAVQPKHASITEVDGKHVLRDLDSPDGLFIAGEKVSGDYTLKDHDDIHIGKHTLSYSEERGFRGMTDENGAPVDLSSSSKPKSAWLQILNGQNLGKTISINKNLTNLGKPGVQTAVIARRNDGFFLSHLEGEHPPTVNGKEIGDKAWQLQDGDTIQIGNVKMAFSLT